MSSEINESLAHSPDRLADSPEEFIESLDFLLASGQLQGGQLAGGHIELVNRAQLTTNPGNIHRAHQFPYVCISKQPNQLSETVYFIRGGDAIEAVRTDTGNWRQAEYVIRNGRLYRHATGQEQITNDLRTVDEPEYKPMTLDESEYELVLQAEVDDVNAQLLDNDTLQRYSEFEASKLLPTFKRMAHKAIEFFFKGGNRTSSKHTTRPV